MFLEIRNKILGNFINILEVQNWCRENLNEKDYHFIHYHSPENYLLNHCTMTTIFFENENDINLFRLIFNDILSIKVYK